MLSLIAAVLLNSCCSFCKPKVIVKVEYRYPDFSDCIKLSKVKYSYPPLPKVSRKFLSKEDAKVLLDNLTLRQKEVKALQDVNYCFITNLQKFIEAFEDPEKKE